jgi:hypothetical protein
MVVPRSVATTIIVIVQVTGEIPQALQLILTSHAAIFAIVATDIHPR